MNEKPILFSGPMVRAILDGRKVMTRRVMKPQPKPGKPWRDWVIDPEQMDLPIAYCPYGIPGDQLWVRETFMEHHGESKVWHRASQSEQSLVLLAELGEKWRPSIFMPRWASRLTLEITGVKVERVQDISGGDAVAEGVTVYGQSDLKRYDDAIDGTRIASVGIENAAVKLFAELWDSINGKRPGCSWSDNPWCWVLSFKRVTP